MQTITIAKGRPTERTHRIYTRAEADERGIDYVYWKQVSSEAQHALTDDGYVMEVWKIDTYTTDRGITRNRIRFGGAQKWVTPYAELIWEDHAKNEVYTRNNPHRSWDELEARTARVARAIDALCASFMATGSFDWERAGQLYRPDQKIPSATLKRLFHKERFRKMIRDKLKELYNELGFTEEWTIEVLMDAAEIARRENQALNLIRAHEAGVKLLGMGPETVRQTEQKSVNYSEQILDEVSSYQASQRIITEGPTTSPGIEAPAPDGEQGPGDESS